MAGGWVHLPHDGLPPGVLIANASAEQHSKGLGLLAPLEPFLAGSGASPVWTLVVSSGERVALPRKAGHEGLEFGAMRCGCLQEGREDLCREAKPVNHKVDLVLVTAAQRRGDPVRECN